MHAPKILRSIGEMLRVMAENKGCPMSVAFLPAIVFLAAVLVVAEIVWLREGAEEEARSLVSGEAGPRLAPSPHPATIAPRWAMTPLAKGSKRSA